MSTSTMPVGAHSAAQPATQPAAAAQPISLHLTRTLRVTPERVFNAWTQPVLMRQWFGPAGFECYEATADPTPGGNYAIGMRGTPADWPERGELDCRIEGAYQQIVPYSLLVFTYRGSWRPASEQTTVTLRFTPVDDGTLPELTQTGFVDEEGATGHDIGWNSSLSKLEALLSRQ